LKKYLDTLAKKYYEGNPKISDEEWDSLVEFHEYNKVGYEVQGANKVHHKNRLYSLQKFYETDTLPFTDGVVTPKLDGSAISLTYVNGKLLMAATRGNGIEGENVFNNFYAWPKIPNNISLAGVVQIVGEIVAPKTIKNSRNYAAGAARLKSTEEFLSREIEFITYTIHAQDMHSNKYYLEDLTLLEALSFRTVKEENIADIYPTDGVVYRKNSNIEFKALGHTDKHPRGAFALKNTNDVEIKETELLDVQWQIGKSGKVCPVAIFEEIEIDGAKINRASLHNAGFVEDLDLSIGDILLVTRSGGIIPKVLGVV